jgi:RHS repeat-associated protein
VITDSAGVIKAESDYYPWGSELQFVNNDSNDYKFTGKKRDSETGLDNFGARYYSNAFWPIHDARLGSQSNRCPYAEFADPQSLNVYTYVRNIPTTKVDADGHCFWDACLVEATVTIGVGELLAYAGAGAAIGTAGGWITKHWESVKNG